VIFKICHYMQWWCALQVKHDAKDRL
jgi:hypothetical protein